MQEGGCDGVCSRTVFAGFVMGIPIVLPSLLTSRSHPHHAPVPTTFPSLLSSCPHRHHAPIPIMLPSLSPLLSRSQTHCAPVPVATMLLSPSCSHLCPPLPPRSQSHCHHRSSPVTVVLLSPLFSHPHHCNPNPVVLVLLPTPRSRPRRTAAAAGRFPEPLGRIRTSPTASTPGGHQPRGHHQTLLQPSIAPGIPPCQTCPIPGGTAPSVPRSRASTPCITSRPRPGARPAASPLCPGLGTGCGHASLSHVAARAQPRGRSRRETFSTAPGKRKRNRDTLLQNRPQIGAKGEARALLGRRKVITQVPTVLLPGHVAVRFRPPLGLWVAATSGGDDPRKQQEDLCSAWKFPRPAKQEENRAEPERGGWRRDAADREARCRRRHSAKRLFFC